MVAANRHPTDQSPFPSYVQFLKNLVTSIPKTTLLIPRCMNKHLLASVIGLDHYTVCDFTDHETATIYKEMPFVYPTIGLLLTLLPYFIVFIPCRRKAVELIINFIALPVHNFREELLCDTLSLAIPLETSVAILL